MGMQYRNGHCYYTRSRRINGKVKREYVASGVLAEASAAFEEADRLEAQQARHEAQAQWQQERQAADALDAAVNIVCESATALFRAAMETAGFHQHTRGEWRKTRNTAQKNMAQQASGNIE